ncbi:MAG: hypothetical protein H5T24_02610 [Bacteroidales bacterium]|nr:hypothetical protein [Bacteroidales bacterium]
MNSTKFAEQWIKSWNSHDLNEILSHYSDDIVITTPRSHGFVIRAVVVRQGQPVRLF